MKICRAALSLLLSATAGRAAFNTGRVSELFSERRSKPQFESFQFDRPVFSRAASGSKFANANTTSEYRPIVERAFSLRLSRAFDSDGNAQNLPSTAAPFPWSASMPASPTPACCPSAVAATASCSSGSGRLRRQMSPRRSSSGSTAE